MPLVAHTRLLAAIGQLRVKLTLNLTDLQKSYNIVDKKIYLIFIFLLTPLVIFFVGGFIDFEITDPIGDT